jgi:hypothetical protein
MIHFTIPWVHWLIILWPGEIIGLLMLIAVVVLFDRAQKNPHNKMDFATMFVWPGTNQTSVILVITFVASLTGIWVVIDEELKTKLQPEIFLAMIGTLVLGKGMTEAVNAWRDRPPNVPASNTQQIVGTAGVVSSASVVPAAPAAPAVDPIPAAPAAPAQPCNKPKRKRS